MKHVLLNEVCSLDILINIGKRAYIYYTSTIGMWWMRENFCTVSHGMVDVDLEHIDDIEELMEKDGLSIDIRCFWRQEQSKET